MGLPGLAIQPSSQESEELPVLPGEELPVLVIVLPEVGEDGVWAFRGAPLIACVWGRKKPLL